MTGLFVVFEGADGTGKSTQVVGVSTRLRTAGNDVVVTREPGGSIVAEKLRELVLDPEHDITPTTEALIFAAARADHIDKTIAPALAAGQIVISDRFVGSSIAYQSAGRGLSRQAIVDINAYATGGLAPDVTVVLDLPETMACRRRVARGEIADRMESAPDGFQDAVRASFLDQAKAAPERHLIVDASQTPEAITDEILSHLSIKFGVTIS
ncbi:dTMP kinase [Enteractinococcus coprophilus]|uniref:dTMP kinase n=1 Tax=Enteractinococcus coprophilus TaxID=1027633 RepID=UPI001FE496D3|nr:dTMP kinase [Enteractinococcus coprophilus]